jgi:plasmid stabilization system protein ParE
MAGVRESGAEVEALDAEVEAPDEPYTKDEPEVEVEDDRLDAEDDGGPGEGDRDRGEDGDDSGGSGKGGGGGKGGRGGDDGDLDEPASPRPRTPAWRERRIVVAAVVAVVCLATAGVLAFAGRSGGGGGDDDSGPLPTQTSTSMETGGIDVDAPDGWTAAPLPQFGFGIAVPPGWEAVVLSPEMLNSLNRSDPAVTGFIDAAHAAAEQGSVFYAAGEDREGRVTDLKVNADPEAGVEDVDALEDYARRLADTRRVGSPRVEPVDGADRPTVRINFSTTLRSDEGDEITTHGVETLILGPRGIVWSIIVTSENPAIVDDLTPRILDTLTFARAPN